MWGKQADTRRGLLDLRRLLLDAGRLLLDPRRLLLDPRRLLLDPRRLLLDPRRLRLDARRRLLDLRRLLLDAWCRRLDTWRWLLDAGRLLFDARWGEQPDTRRRLLHARRRVGLLRQNGRATLGAGHTGLLARRSGDLGDWADHHQRYTQRGGGAKKANTHIGS
ncbi:MAG: hypothetical protein KGH84_06350 [Paracoccaceae bacterium]|nr:hypothetical protein [Paracoccaceae bacterium]